MLRATPAFVLASAFALTVAGQEPGTDPPSFHRDIRPLLQARCQGCHQPAKAGFGLDLASHAALMKGSKLEPVVVAGKPEESVLLDAVLPFEGDPPSMPKDAAPLTDAEVDLLRRWIAAGAKDDTPKSSGPVIDAEHPPVYRRAPVLTSLDFSPDGELLAVSGYHEVVLHRADGSEIVRRLVGMSERIESVAFSPDGARLAVAGGSPARFGELQIWEVESGALLHSVPVTYDTIYGANWSPDGRLIAFGCSDHSVRVVEADTGKEVMFQGAHTDWVRDTAFSLDSTHLVSVSRDSTMKLIKVETHQFIDDITSITPGVQKGGIISLVRHATKDELLAAGADGVPRIYRMYREKKRVIGDDYNLIRAFDALPGRVFAVDWSTDGKRIAAGSSAKGRGVLRVCNAEDGSTLWTWGFGGPIYAVAFHPSGNVLAAAGFDGQVHLHAAANGEFLRVFAPVPLTEVEVGTR